MKKFICMIGILLLLSGCGRNEGLSLDSTSAEELYAQESSKETNSFLEELATQETESEPESSEIIYPVHVAGQASLQADVHDAEKNSVSRKTITYTGEDISLEFSLNFLQEAEEIEMITATFFLLNDGIPQSFYFEDAAEAGAYASLTCAKEEFAQDNVFHVRFQPEYVPYGEDTCMLLFVVLDNNYHFTHPGTITMTCGFGVPFYVTADSKENAVEWDAEIPVYGAPVEYNWRYGLDSSVYGVAVTEKNVDASQLPTYRAYTSGEPLYATLGTAPDTLENEEYQLFAFMDGKPAPLFDGSWYCSIYVDPEQLYEIPLDMSQIPSGEHLFYFVRLSPETQYYMMKYGKMEDGHYTLSDGAVMYNVTIP